MDSTHDIRDHPLAQVWEVLQAQHTQGEALQVDSNRLAFAEGITLRNLGVKSNSLEDIFFEMVTD